MRGGLEVQDVHSEASLGWKSRSIRSCKEAAVCGLFCRRALPANRSTHGDILRSLRGLKGAPGGCCKWSQAAGVANTHMLIGRTEEKFSLTQEFDMRTK